MKWLSCLAAAVVLPLLSGLFLSSCSNKRPGKPRILVFSKTKGFRHGSIAAGQAALFRLGEQYGFEVDTTEDASYFHPDSLEPYAAVVFLNTSDSKDSLLNHYQENAFERYIQAGGGFVGVHAAADSEYQWGWYGRLVGGYFNGHPPTQQATLRVVDSTHPSTRHLPAEWTRVDEWYNFKNLNPDINVLLTIDESSYEGGTNGAFHPMAWYHEYDGGRAFFTALGHTPESYSEEAFLQHLLGGIQYAIGGNLRLDYRKAHTPPVPEERRFTKTVLAQGSFFEPMEFAILPNLDILIVQRRGEILQFRQADRSLRRVAKLDVYHQSGVPDVNAEEGLMGITADPDFATNGYIYLFYAPVDTSVNRLSRFVFRNDSLDLSSEKIILQFYSQRKICCHAAGSLAFGNDRVLFLSTGDNSTPFNEKGQRFVNHGYAPLDERPGHEAYDARRSSGNTNDLRGKILRIRINEDGSYSIPDGNLFREGQEKTRPEIYIMGNRNPFRISVDRETGFLYWGEVGPDARKDSAERGPKGYDEVNQARRAGNFGWPLFVGRNFAYREYDYATGKSGKIFDPEKPVNDSRNNSGLRELPPAEPAFIFYPYDQSREFPQVGTGGRNAMAGPVYRQGDNRVMPEYYNGKLFIYDWVRGWIKAVSLRPNGDFDKMEPFMESTPFHAPIDMEVGPDGKIYVLEYGKGWFRANPDAMLSRIDYHAGELPPPPAEPQPAGDTPASVDSAAFPMGHQTPDSIAAGFRLMANLDCKTCHQVRDKSIGPAYEAVAARYEVSEKNTAYLIERIISGGAGVWGEAVMPAHPTLPREDARRIVQWIQSLRPAD